MTDLHEPLEATFSSELRVEYRDHMGDDDAIVEAMLVSTQGEDALDSEATPGRINFLMSNRHGTPFEQTAIKVYVKAPIAVFREWHRHRIGFCLPGDAMVSVGTWRNGQKKSIADIYRDWHEGVPDSMGRTRLLPSCRHLVARTLNTDTGIIEAARMVDVYQSGIKPIRKITLESGRALRCSDDHQVWSPEGWVKAKDVAVGDTLGRQGKVAIGKLVGIPKRLRMGIQEWTTQQKPSVVAPVDTCAECGSVFTYDELEVDHDVPVSADLLRALDLENLRPLCRPCHRTKSNDEQPSGSRRRPTGLGVRWERVVGNESDGEEMTYDISMPAPWHNFVCDEFIVHNSYNETSGRYRELDTHFYIPPPERPLVQVGKPGAYSFVPGTDQQYAEMVESQQTAHRVAATEYRLMLDLGIAKEVARGVLGVYLYTDMITTLNVRSAMAFLSLRQEHPPEEAMFPSHPMWEINRCADQLEEIVTSLFPMAMATYVANKRVCP